MNTHAAPAPKIFWENIVALVIVHVGAVLGLLYAIFVNFSWWTLGLAVVCLVCCTLATTGGYHRLFAHRTYKAAWPLRLFYLLFGAAAAQGSVLRWAGDHRVHHAHTDKPDDPYNIRRGFWWAHVGWLFFRGQTHPELVRDLSADPLVRLQDRFYLLVLILVGFLFPTAVAAAWGDAMGGLLIAGFLRLAVQYQAAFSINSLAHSLGTQPYSRSVSARDSFITAVLTLGEGYHNYHHRFPGDYRNGVRAFHFDPTKWWVWAMSKVGLAYDLKRATGTAIQDARDAVAARLEPPAVPPTA